MKGPGDTFDVSWSHDGSLLSACFSSGTLVVQDASVYKDVQFGNTLTPVPASQEGTNTESVVEAEGKPTATASSTYTHVTASKGSKHGAAASRAHAQSQSHQSSNTDREAASSGSKAVTEKGEKVTELKNDKVKGRSDSVATAVSTTATDMKVDEIIPAVENDPTTEADAMQVDTTSSSHGHGNADKDDLPASCSDEVNTPMDEVTASIVGDKGEVTDMITDDIDDKEKDRDGDL